MFQSKEPVKKDTTGECAIIIDVIEPLPKHAPADGIIDGRVDEETRQQMMEERRNRGRVNDYSQTASVYRNKCLHDVWKGNYTEETTIDMCKYSNKYRDHVRVEARQTDKCTMTFDEWYRSVNETKKKGWFGNVFK